ncbi:MULTISPECIES: D-Ala-D-Ala carboxypeptidase family metallohydrolase [Pseudomonas]|uniref:D-Ala-D-Ala carboxypeptidase family metallohydrolase n=1 Tax=Pseudomonas TaxID=286 RepID=UPI0018E6B9C1|nr:MULTISPECIES: D-Ala-D-Ala carboxypeptidase family metallohydrolase [Pseudomonas]MBI6919437.1 peptidase M15 [Pseudomonas monteilii]MCE0938370.1 D-Ala-D-Ala carboxypeptidase family metallohydrolase [Pseudomonas kurunegalensis]
MLITPHFTLDEMIVSQLAARDGFDNTPPPQARANLQLLCGALEQVRALFDAPIIISSGYRSEKVNQLIGGSPNSQHVQGLAADFTVIEVSPRDTVRRISNSTIAFDQLILEFDRWVHLSVTCDTPRRQVLTVRKGGGYLPGLQ